MRWGDLFDQLEDDFLSARDQALVGRDGTHRRVDHLLSLVAGARAGRHRVTVGMRHAVVLSVLPKAVGRGWFSGITEGENGSGLIIPLGAVDWIRCPTNPVSEEAKGAGVLLDEVLLDLARRRVTLRCEARGGIVRGVVTGVGEGFIDVDPGQTTDSVTRVALDALHCIVLESFPWG